MEVKFDNIPQSVSEIVERITARISASLAQYREIMPEFVDLTNLKRMVYYWFEVGNKLRISDEKLVKLTEIFAFIYLAHEIHRRVLDETVPSERTEIQYRVLMGDYMYGNFFRELSRADLLQYLAPLAEIILAINEAALLNKQDNFVAEKVLLRKSFRLLGTIAGLPQDTVEALANLGEEIVEPLARLNQKEFSSKDINNLLKSLDYLK